MATLDEMSRDTVYQVASHGGVAWRYLFAETETIEHEECDQQCFDDCPDFDDCLCCTVLEEERETGNAIMLMVGDDRRFSVDPSDCEPLAEGDYCPGCGQIGCGHVVSE